MSIAELIASERRLRIMRFAFVGVATALLYFTLAQVLVRLGSGLHGASLVAFTVALSFQFLMHRRFTFRSPNSYRQDLPRFLAIISIGYLASELIVYLAGVYALPNYVALMAVIVVTPITNWIGLSRWVFTWKAH